MSPVLERVVGMARARARVLTLSCAALFACGGEPTDPESAFSIEGLRHPAPITIGSPLAVMGAFETENLDREGGDRRLEDLAVGDVELSVIALGERFVMTPFSVEPLTFLVPREFVDRVGDGEVSIVARLEGAIETLPFDASWMVARLPALSLFEGPQGDVHYNDEVVLRGAGYHGSTEGRLELCASGTFTFEGDEREVQHCEPAFLVDETSRDRILARLSVALGSELGEPGTFEGALYVESEREGEEIRRTAALATTLRFGRPDVFAFAPDSAPLEARVRVQGAGFLGMEDDRAEATTVLRMVGTFTPSGGAPRAITEDLFGEVIAGDAVEWVLRAEVADGQLQSTFFGSASGIFEGSLTPALVADASEVVGDEVPTRFELAPVRQTVWLRFLPQFGPSLARFGLQAADAVLRERIAQRVAALYEGYRVDVTLDEPLGVSPDGVTTIEVGGPDPTGFGLFGLDNSPGKDVGNLRLFDAIGGANAETQADGFPGYGGVFVESYLWWSSHPELGVERPLGAPDEDPMFDALFDPPRTTALTLEEARGEAGRLALAARVIEAFANMTAETIAHELGHALGLAQPFGSPMDFHNARDGEGCLMDSGRNRPFGERIGVRGFEPTHFCDESAAYLRRILGGR